MKCGTTSLWSDLRSNPAIFMPDDKEPGALARDEVLTPAGRAEYAGHFRGALPGQVCGEASTAYSKLPDVPGVPARARRVCGEPRAIYLIREPVARIVSHHYHEVAAGTMEPDLERAIRRSPSLLDYTRYATQISPWIEELGRERVKIVVFESYVADRRATAAEIARFLGVEPAFDDARLGEVRNRSVGKPAPRGLAWRTSRGRLYRSWVRPLVPEAARRRLTRWLLPEAPPPPAPPSASTVDWILERLGGELESLRRLLGRPEPVWDLDEVRRRFGLAPLGESVGV